MRLDDSGVRALAPDEWADAIEDDDPDEVAADPTWSAIVLCGVLQEAGLVFHAGGFGSDDWRST